MNRVQTITLRLLTVFLFLFLCMAAGTRAQTPSPTPEAKPADQGGGDPFGLEYAKPLPPGVVGPEMDINGRPRGEKPDVGCEEVASGGISRDWPTRLTVGPGWRR